MIRIPGLIGLLLLSTVVPACAGWRAGVARTVITPEAPVWMSGYAARDHAATGKLTELWAKALVLEDESGHRGVLISLDLVGIDRETSLAIRRQLVEAHKLKLADIAICTSHTHSGPVFGGNLQAMYALDDEEWDKLAKYTKQVQQHTVQIVGEAFDQLQEAELAWGVGQCRFAVNRRENREPDVPALRERGALKGPTDHEVPVLTVSAEGALQAVLFGYACHATTLSDYDWCGDWPGYAQIAIEEAHPGVTAMFFAGCGADQNPIPRRTVALAQQYGTDMADAVEDVLDSSMTPVAASLTTAYDEIDLPFAHLPTSEELQQALASENVYEVRRAKHLIATYGDAESIAATYPYPVQTWQLGDVTGVFLGGEVVVDYSRAIKGLTSDVDFVAGYVNDVMAYIPSERVLSEGGYEGGGAMVYYGLPSPWKTGVEALILDTVQSQLPVSTP